MALSLRMRVAGGGTGGPAFPGIALAEAFLLLRPDGAVSFVGTEEGLEARAVPARGFPIDFVPSGQVRGKGIGALTGVLRMALGFPAAVAVLRRRRPDLVFGVGGYASVPVALAAGLLRIPLFLQEQNAVPGRPTRFLAGGAFRVFAGFSAAVPFFPADRVEVTGNPVRPEIVSAAREHSGSFPAETPPVGLRLGGSQGAGAINNRVLGMARRAKREGAAIRFLLQTGTREHEAVARPVREETLPVDPFPFTDRIGDWFPRCHAVLMRAGALSIAEAALFGRPCVLVPYPFAADDHQAGNARGVCASGAGGWVRGGGAAGGGGWAAVGERGVVVSPAARPGNPEVLEAHRRKIPVIPRAEILAELMRMKYGIAIAGTHGKTTTTSMIATILGSRGMDPTIVIGGKLNSMGSNARLGKGEFLVAEADESDGSFLKLSPTIAVVTNIDREHMDHYKDMDEVKDTYLTFINNIPFYGCSILCLDHPNIQGLIPKVTRRHITYGMAAQADFSAREVEIKGMKTLFDVWLKGKRMGRVAVHVPGEHNVYNALAAIAVAMELDIDFEDAKDSIAGFNGVERRFQVKGICNGITVIDDYGHHPVEIKATLKAVKDGWNSRVVVVFQPHRYSRTQDLFGEFLSAFNDADTLVLADIYPAGEERIAGASSDDLYRGIKTYGHKDVVYIPDKKDIPAYLSKITKPGDILITLGAGDIWQVGEEMLRRANDRRPKMSAGGEI